MASARHGICAAGYSTRVLSECAQPTRIVTQGPTVTKFVMILTGCCHWIGCFFFLLSEFTERFQLMDGIHWRNCPTCIYVEDGPYAFSALA